MQFPLNNTITNKMPVEIEIALCTVHHAMVDRVICVGIWYNAFGV